MALAVQCQGDRLYFGDRISVGFQRTLRVPDDGRRYPLPPGLGPFPIHGVNDYVDRVPLAWRDAGGYFIALYQREALWISFQGAPWRPNAVKVGVGGVNAVSGRAWDEALHDTPQDYVVVPDQPWLDGINAGDGSVRQFVAMPLGLGYTVEGQLTGEERTGAIQLVVFEPRPGRFTEERLARDPATPAQSMGLAAGGVMRQKIYPDPYGIDTWDLANRGAVRIHVLNAEQYAQITGRKPPLTPISTETYVERGFPWFELYDEDRGDVAPPDALRRVKSVDAIDAARAASNGRKDD